MQDWDFPHFTNTLDVNLPGFHKHIFNFEAVDIQFSGNFHFNTRIENVLIILSKKRQMVQLWHHFWCHDL